MAFPVKKALGVMLFAMVLFVGFAPSVRADIGPKRTLEFAVTGIDEDFQGGLMFHVDGAVETFTDPEMAEWGWNKNPLRVALNGYRDADGFVLVSLYWPYMYEGEPLMYRIPSEVKYAVLTDTGQVLISEAISPRMFSSSVVFDFTGYETLDLASDPVAYGSATERIPVVRILLDWLLRVVMTVIAELGVLILFKYWKKTSIVFAAIVNAASQTLLTAGVLVGYYCWWSSYGAAIVLVGGELAVFAIESVLYVLFLREKGRWSAFLYGFVANLASFLLSFLLIVIPDWNRFFRI
jgi:hypothetical protein